MKNKKLKNVRSNKLLKKNICSSVKKNKKDRFSAKVGKTKEKKNQQKNNFFSNSFKSNKHFLKSNSSNRTKYTGNFFCKPNDKKMRINILTKSPILQNNISFKSFKIPNKMILLKKNEKYFKKSIKSKENTLKKQKNPSLEKYFKFFNPNKKIKTAVKFYPNFSNRNMLNPIKNFINK